MTEEHYQAAELTEPFYFERPTETPDGLGGLATTYVRNPVSGTDYHFCKVRPLRGTEREVGGALAAVSEVMFVVFKGIGIRATDRLVYDGLTYNITRVNPSGQSAFQELEATAGVTQ